MSAEAKEEFNEVIFNRKDVKDELTHNEIWDDELLINWYDTLTHRSRQKLAERLPAISSVSDSDCSNSHRTELINGFSHEHFHNNMKRRKKKKAKKKNEWNIGDLCRARYSVDDEIYEATIFGIKHSEGTCKVRFLGYENDEEVSLCSLLKSKGTAARRDQVENVNHSCEKNVELENGLIVDSDVSTDQESQSKTMPPPSHSRPNKSSALKNMHTIPHIPNLPPPPALGLVDGADEMSSEALHTMLMSWYMTGYHTGYYQGLNQRNKRKKSSGHSSNT